RAARRAGLEAEAVKRTISEIPALVLPAVLVLRDGTTRILLAIDHKARSAKVVDPSVNQPPQIRTFDSLNTDHLGYVFFVRPLAQAHQRAVSAGDLPKDHWFWSVVRKYWANYSHVALSAFIINMIALMTPLFIMNVYDRVVPNGAMASLIALAIGMGIA